MNDVHFRSKDLNLLVVFEALLVERNASRAAQRLGLTQSAVSHALKRLRADFGDDLLVRSSKGMAPTPFALQLSARLGSVLSELESIYRLDEEFEPKKAEARFVITTTDYIEATILPGLIRLLRHEAPGITIVSRPAAGQLPQAELESGAVDLAIAGYFANLPEGLYSQRLYTDTFRTAVRRGHPKLKSGRLTLQSFAEAEHVLISPQGDLKTQMDGELAKLGMKRRIVAAMGGLLSSAWIMAESDLVLTALSRDLQVLSRYLPIDIFPTPIELAEVHTCQVWHERTHRTPLHKWLRSAIERVARSP